MAQAAILGWILLSSALVGATSRDRYLLDDDWKFQLDSGSSGGGFGPECKAGAFPEDYNNKQCMGLQQVGAKNEDECSRACCNAATCEIYQWCNTSNCMPSKMPACWIGKISKCTSSAGWISKGRSLSPTPPPSPGARCDDPRCQPKAAYTAFALPPSFDDSSWRKISVPHDFVVEGTFSKQGDKSHGYLLFAKGWYRKRFTLPAGTPNNAGIYLDFDGTQANSKIYLNGQLLGGHASGYTPYRFRLDGDNTSLKYGEENVLVAFVDATHPDGWWYDGGGIYRHVWLTVLSEVHVQPWGVYVPADVTSSIIRSQNFGAPRASASVKPQVELENFGKTSTNTEVIVEIYGPDHESVGKVSSPATVPGGGNATIQLPTVAVDNAELWHVGRFNSSTQPLYTALVSVLVQGAVVDSINQTFGIRKTAWSADTGFWLNDERVKIMGNANHQDFAGVGVAVPDVLQAHRIAKLQEMGSNAWRTAHNVPTEALLDAGDQMGFLFWDENHRNGQDAECEILIRRDRNHPCVIIWSLCNEVLCNTPNITGDMRRLKKLIKSLDPLGGRPVSANNNGVNGPDTPLDLQGFDYATSNYDSWHQRAPHVPAISSETSSAVSDRDTLINDATAGRVSSYDDHQHGNTVPWGQSAEGAWGGVGISAGQGILTRDFIAGGFTWTGWDYKGEPTPYAWPDINSHFGIIDEAGFPKDRYFWYKAWFAQPSPPILHLFPHWNWNTNQKIDVWAFSNADEVELLVNGKSLGRSQSGNYSHAAWPQVAFEPGEITAKAFMKGSSSPVATQTRRTAKPATALLASIKDEVGQAGLYAGCSDVALVQVFAVDADGQIDPTSSNNVTFSVSDTSKLAFLGSGNGDPTCHVSDKSSTRPVFAGKVLGVFQELGVPGAVTITATAAGLKSTSITVNIVDDQKYSSWWCHREPHL